MLKKHLGFGFNLISIALFIPGIFLPMFHLNMEIKAQLSQSTLQSELINQTLSILTTVEELWQDDRILVALLIFIFSIVLPISKSLLMTFAYFKKHTPVEDKIYQWVGKISKWSMADVFVVAIFLAFLSTNHAQTTIPHQLSLFGFNLHFEMSSETLSNVGVGFYYFTGYCLLSLLSTQLSTASIKNKCHEKIVQK